MIKEQADETSWEIGQFLNLALQCHPLVLETFVAPVEAEDEWGTGLRTLFPCVWSAQTVYRAFVTYCDNQRKKMLEKKDGRPEKYAASYLRVLFNLCELLERETFTIRVASSRSERRFGKSRQATTGRGKSSISASIGWRKHPGASPFVHTRQTRRQWINSWSTSEEGFSIR